MKKGKANLPSHMRSQYKRSQEMEAYRQQMIESQVSGGSGVEYPVWMRADIISSPPPSATSLITPLLPFPLFFSFHVAPVGPDAFRALRFRSGGRDQKMGADGLPVFNLYVRGSAKNVRVI